MKQEALIKTQEEIIEHAEKEIKRSHEATNAAITGGVSISTLLLLLLLL